jgi:hypothetical protein
MKWSLLLVALLSLSACASGGTPDGSNMTQERSVLELQRASLERLLPGVEPYLEARNLKVLCVVPARLTSVRGSLQWTGSPRDRRTRGPANWLVARVHPPGRQMISSLDCQNTDDGWIVRETGAVAALVNVGDLDLHTGTDATVEMWVGRSRLEFMSFTCNAHFRQGRWIMGQCLCKDQRGAAAVCLTI